MLVLGACCAKYGLTVYFAAVGGSKEAGGFVVEHAVASYAGVAERNECGNYGGVEALELVVERSECGGGELGLVGRVLGKAFKEFYELVKGIEAVGVAELCRRYAAWFFCLSVFLLWLVGSGLGGGAPSL